MKGGTKVPTRSYRKELRTATLADQCATAGKVKALVESLLAAIVRADGDALVMHVGDRPYVVAASGTIDLSEQGLNLEAMSGMLAELLLRARALRLRVTIRANGCRASPTSD